MKNIHKIIISLAGVTMLIVIVVVVAISLSVFEQMEKAAELHNHTFVVLNSADDLLSELIDAETGQRGYLLTGDETFLEPYLAARDNIKGNLEKLHQLSLISAAHKHLDALAPLVDAKLAYLSNNIELRRNNDMTAVMVNIRGSNGKPLMDSIRAEIKSFILIEQGALAQRDVQFRAKMHILFILIVIASLLMLLFVLLFIYFIYRETQQRFKDLVHLETQHLLEIQENTNKQLQQANVTLQISEEKFAVTLSSIGDAVMATDAEGHVTFLNSIAEQLTGWTQVQAVVRPADEIFSIIN